MLNQVLFTYSKASASGMWMMRVRIVAHVILLLNVISLLFQAPSLIEFTHSRSPMSLIKMMGQMVVTHGILLLNVFSFQFQHNLGYYYSLKVTSEGHLDDEGADRGLSSPVASSAGGGRSLAPDGPSLKGGLPSTRTCGQEQAQAADVPGALVDSLVDCRS
jgi:hypothetical protein